MIRVYAKQPDCVFKFRDFLCAKDRRLFDKLLRSLSGKRIYFPKIRPKDSNRLLRRDRAIRKAFSALRQHDKSVVASLFEIQRIVPGAHILQIGTLRKIVYTN